MAKPVIGTTWSVRHPSHVRIAHERANAAVVVKNRRRIVRRAEALRFFEALHRLFERVNRVLGAARFELRLRVALPGYGRVVNALVFRAELRENGAGLVEERHPTRGESI